MNPSKASVGDQSGWMTDAPMDIVVAPTIVTSIRAMYRVVMMIR